jgi:hypothetical protein
MVAPVTISISAPVLFTPGADIAIAGVGGFPQLAATVTNVTSDGKLALRVLPPNGDPQNVVGVEHSSVTSVGESCWDHPEKPPGSGNAVSTLLTVSDGNPATWPLAQLGGLVLISQYPPDLVNFGSGKPCHAFVFFGTTMGTAITHVVPSGGFSVTAPALLTSDLRWACRERKATAQVGGLRGPR